MARREAEVEGARREIQGDFAVDVSGAPEHIQNIFDGLSRIQTEGRPVEQIFYEINELAVKVRQRERPYDIDLTDEEIADGLLRVVTKNPPSGMLISKVGLFTGRLLEVGEGEATSF